MNYGELLQVFPSANVLSCCRWVLQERFRSEGMLRQILKASDSTSFHVWILLGFPSEWCVWAFLGTHWVATCSPSFFHPAAFINLKLIQHCSTLSTCEAAPKVADLTKCGALWSASFGYSISHIFPYSSCNEFHMHRAGHSVLLNAMWLAKTSKTQRMLLGCGCVALQGTQICSLAMSLKRCYPPKSLGRMDIRYIYMDSWMTWDYMARIVDIQMEYA